DGLDQHSDPEYDARPPARPGPGGLLDDADGHGADRGSDRRRTGRTYRRAGDRRRRRGGLWFLRRLVLLVSAGHPAGSAGIDPGAIRYNSSGGIMIRCSLICISTLSLYAADAELIFHSGKIITADPKFSIQQAIAVAGGRIAAIGSNAAVLKLR